jgi:hypothetical protein
MDIKTIVKGTTAVFSHYRKGLMYYTVEFIDPAHPNYKVKYLFPVQLEDIGDATLEASEKAITLMRYINKALKDNTFVKVTS